MATTFTLDLTTAVVPPLAFASFEVRGTPDPIAALEAVRSCTDRVDIFCQAGQIVVPHRHSDLMAFLEPMIHPVRRPRPGYLFHPKLWFLQYKAEGEPDRFRLLCSTRNLTDSHAWDAVVTLDGHPTTRDVPANRSLAALIRHLPSLAVRVLEPERADRISTLATAAMRVQWEPPEGVEEIRFHAFGVRRMQATPDFSGYRHLVISPFCNEDGLAHLTREHRGEVTVVSRPETLDRIRPESVGGFRTFVLDPLAALDTVDDGGGEPVATPRIDLETLSGLHAKVTVVERNHRAHVFVGSPNATSSGYGGNVEFAVELQGGAGKLGVQTYLSPDAPFAALLQEYQAGGGGSIEPEEEALRQLLNQLRSLAEIPLTLTVGGSDASGYGLVLTSAKPVRLGKQYCLRAELLTRPGHAVTIKPGAALDIGFSGVPLADITPFVILLLTDLENSTQAEPLEMSTVVHAALVSDPASRLDEVLARQVDTPEKFVRFLTLLLGLSDISPLATVVSDPGSVGAWAGTGASGVFELIVIALARNPAALHDLDRLVTRLQSTGAGRRVLPDDFGVLWQPVQQALAALGDTA